MYFTSSTACALPGSQVFLKSTWVFLSYMNFADEKIFSVFYGKDRDIRGVIRVQRDG